MIKKQLRRLTDDALRKKFLDNCKKAIRLSEVRLLGETGCLPIKEYKKAMASTMLEQENIKDILFHREDD